MSMVTGRVVAALAVALVGAVALLAFREPTPERPRLFPASPPGAAAAPQESAVGRPDPWRRPVVSPVPADSPEVRRQPVPGDGSPQTDSGAVTAPEMDLESYLLDGGSAVSIARARDLMHREDLQELLQGMFGSGRQNQEATGSYSDLFANQPEIYQGRLALDALECGGSVCVALVSVYDETAWPAYESRLQGQKGLPTWVWMATPHQRTDGILEYRLVFSISEDVNSIAAPLGG